MTRRMPGACHGDCRYEVRAALHDGTEEICLGWTDRLDEARRLRDGALDDYAGGSVLIIDHVTDHAVA